MWVGHRARLSVVIRFDSFNVKFVEFVSLSIASTSYNMDCYSTPISISDDDDDDDYQLCSCSSCIVGI